MFCLKYSPTSEAQGPPQLTLVHGLSSTRWTFSSAIFSKKKNVNLINRWTTIVGHSLDGSHQGRLDHWRCMESELEMMELYMPWVQANKTMCW